MLLSVPVVVQAVRKDKTRISGTFLNGFQVVRMVELLGLLGFVEYIREEGDW